MIKPLLLKIAFLIIFASSPVAEAYVLQGLHLLDLMTKSIGSPGRMTVKQEVTLYGYAGEADPTVFTETLYFNSPGKFRSEAVFQDTTRILLVSGASALVVVNQKQKATIQSRYDLYKDLLFQRPRSVLEYNLARNGVDVSISSFGRFDGKPVYIIGAKYPDQSTPQVWLDQETFRPIRWIINGGPDHLEAVYTDWKRSGNMWYPGSIRLIEGKQTIRDMQVVQIETTATFPADFFDIEVMKSTFPPDSLVTGNDPASDTMEEVHQEIEDFNKALE